LLAPVCTAAGVWTAERALRSQQEQADRRAMAAMASSSVAEPAGAEPSAVLPSVGRTLATG
jgi:hypothetical protein